VFHISLGSLNEVTLKRYTLKIAISLHTTYLGNYYGLFRAEIFLYETNVPLGMRFKKFQGMTPGLPLANSDERMYWVVD